MLSSIIKSSSDFVIKRLVEFINWLFKKSSNSKYEKIQRNKTVQFNFNYSWLNIRELSSTVHLKIMFVSVLVVRGWDQASKLDSYSAGRSCGCRRIAAAVPVPGANTRSWCGTIPADSWPDAPTFSVSLHLLIIPYSFQYFLHQFIFHFTYSVYYKPYYKSFRMIVISIYSRLVHLIEDNFFLSEHRVFYSRVSFLSYDCFCFMNLLFFS